MKRNPKTKAGQSIGQRKKAVSVPDSYPKDFKEEILEQNFGMDLSKHKNRRRWRELLAWVCNELSMDDPSLPRQREASKWAPVNRQEETETIWMRGFIRAKTAKDIGHMLESDDNPFLSVVSDVEVLSRIANSLCLSKAEVWKISGYANFIQSKGAAPVHESPSLPILIGAMKYRIIKRDFENRQALAEVNSRKKGQRIKLEEKIADVRVLHDSILAKDPNIKNMALIQQLKEKKKLSESWLKKYFPKKNRAKNLAPE